MVINTTRPVVSLWLSLLILLVGCASSPTQESTGQYIDDSVITSQVLAKLAAAKDTSAMAINVETFKGVVQLSGFVDSTTEAERAAEIANGVAGVKRVENKLTVKTTLNQALAP